MAGKKKTSSAAPEPWERREGESAQAFQAFAAYRDMGAQRSITKVAQKLGKSRELIGRWSSSWNWRARADAWDDETDRLSREELKKGITEMRKNHVEIAKAMLVKAVKAMKNMPEKMSPRDVATMVDVAAKLERLSRGEVTERTEGKQTVEGELSLNSVDLSGLSDKELAALDEIAGKIFS